VFVEPFGPDLRGGHLLRIAPFQLTAAVGAVTMALLSSGDVLLLGVLLGIACADLVVGATGVVVGLAVVGRWGTPSLAALAGGQAVVGAAGVTGPTLLAASAWCAAAALALAAPRRPVATVAFGLAAADVVAGPSAVSSGDGGSLAIRVAASLVAVLLAFFAASWIPPRLARAAALVVAVAAALLVLASP